MDIKEEAIAAQKHFTNSIKCANALKQLIYCIYITCTVYVNKGTIQYSNYSVVSFPHYIV